MHHRCWSALTTFKSFGANQLGEPTRKHHPESSVQKEDRDAGNKAQGDEDKERDPHTNRKTVGKRGLTRSDSHQTCEPFVEFHSISSFRIRRTLPLGPSRLKFM
jgi:hypothetical protein